MRSVLIVALAVGVLFGMVGCIGLGKDDQARMDRLTREEKDVLMALYSERAAMLKHVESETKNITDKVMDKTLTLSDGEKYLKLLAIQSRTTYDKINSAITDVREKYQRERTDLAQKGYGKGDMIVGFILSIVAAITGSTGVTRLWRGSTLNRVGNIGLTSPPS